MYKFLNNKLAGLLVLLAFFVLGNTMLKAQQEADFEFQAYPGEKLDGLEMSWYLYNSDMQPVAVELWMQKGAYKTMDEMDSSEKVVTISESDWYNERGMYYYFLQKEFDRGYYTFFLKAVDANGQVYYSNLSVVNFIDWNNLKYLEFSSQPLEKAIVGEEYKYDVDAYDKEDPDAEIKYLLLDAPSGMVIDESTGVITWTPSAKGYYSVWVHAERTDNPDAMGEQYFSINVFGCKAPAVISGEIRDSKDRLVKEGFVQLYDKNMLDSSNSEEPTSYYEWVVDGKYSVEVDEGEYLLTFQDKYGFFEFYENTFDWEKAKVIPVECGDELTINMKLSEEMSNEIYTVTGSVSYADGIAAEYMQVYFEGTGPKDGREKMIMMSTMTDEDGNYSIELPNGYNYVAYITGDWDPVTGIQRVLYYDQTYNRDEATIIVLESNLNGINFVFDKADSLVYYEVSGNVSKDGGEPVMGAVVAFEGFYNQEYGNGSYFYNSAVTDSLGNYSIMLPEIIAYRAYVTSPYVKLYRPLYYNQTYNPDEAEVIKLTVNRDDINFVIEDPDFKTFKVSGRVTNADGNGIEGAIVVFEGFNDSPDYYYNRWNETVSTDAEGFYEAELPEIFKYIASAYEPFNGDRRKFIQPLYFNQTYNPEQATVIELTSDRNDINFKFNDTDNEYKNSISGIVVNKDNDMIPDVFVMAYFIGNNADDFYFDGRASMVNSDGEFKFASLATGKYVLLAVPKEATYLPGFYKLNDFASMNWDEATILDINESSEVTGIKIKLSAMDYDEKGSMDGVIQANGTIKAVKNSSNERSAVSGAIIYLEDTEGKVQKYATSNNDGSFNLKNLASGAFNLRVEKIGYQPFNKNINFSGDNYYDLGEILLTPEVLSKEDEADFNKLNVKVTPNPVTDNATISFDAVVGTASIRLINVKGHQLISKEINTVNGSNNHTLNLSELANGSYFVVVDNGGRTFAYPIVINR